MVKHPQNILIVTHMYEKSNNGGLPQEEVKNFLIDKSKIVTYLELPFCYASIRRVYLTRYSNGKITKTLKSPTLHGPEWFQYITHFVITICFLIKTGLHYDLCIAMDNLSLLPIIPLRKIKLIQKIIYYSIDYTPVRFKNLFLNSIYQLTNKIASDSADLNWAVSKAIVDEKRKRSILSKKCLIVPVGFRKNKISLKTTNNIDKFHLVFVGILLDKQGIQLAIKSLPILIKKYPRIKLTIIGTGEYKGKLEELVRKLNLDSKIKFTGFLQDSRKVENILTKAGIGLATYKPTPDSFTIYADPGKIKLYLGCGLPIITTSVPTISKQIKIKGCGEVVNYDCNSFISAVEKIITNYRNYRNSVIKMREMYDYKTIYQKAFERSYKIITP